MPPKKRTRGTQRNGRPTGRQARKRQEDEEDEEEDPTKCPPPSIEDIEQRTGLVVTEFDKDDKWFLTTNPNSDWNVYVYLLTWTMSWTDLNEIEKKQLVQLSGSAAQPEGGMFYLYYIGLGTRNRAFHDHKTCAQPDTKRSEFMSPLLRHGIDNGSAKSFKVDKFSDDEEAAACEFETTTYDKYVSFQQSNPDSTLGNVLVNLDRPHAEPINYDYSVVATVEFGDGLSYTFSFAGNAQLKKPFEEEGEERVKAIRVAIREHIMIYYRRALEAKKKGFVLNGLEAALLGRTRNGGGVPPTSSFEVHFAGSVRSSRVLREREQDELLVQVFKRGGKVANTRNAIRRDGQPSLSMVKSAAERGFRGQALRRRYTRGFRGQALEKKVHDFELEYLGLGVAEIGNTMKVISVLNKVEDLRMLLPARNCEAEIKSALKLYPSQPLKGLMILHLSTITDVDFGNSFEGGTKEAQAIINKLNELISVHNISKIKLKSSLKKYPSQPLKGLMILHLSTVTRVDFGNSFEGGTKEVEIIIKKFDELVSFHNGQDAVIKRALKKYPSQPLKGLIDWELKFDTGLDLLRSFKGDANDASGFLRKFHELPGHKSNKKEVKDALEKYRTVPYWLRVKTINVKREEECEAFNSSNGIVRKPTQSHRSAQTLSYPSQSAARKKEKNISLAENLFYFKNDARVEAAQVMRQFRKVQESETKIWTMKQAHILRRKYIEEIGLTVEDFKKKGSAEKEKISNSLTERVFGELRLSPPKKKRKKKK